MSVNAQLQPRSVPLPSISKRRRTFLLALVALLAALAGTWIAVHRISWVGPGLANGLRKIFGPDAVTALEELAYGMEDRVNRLLRRRAAPKTYWEAPAPQPQPHATTPSPPPRSQAAATPFRPHDVGPMHAERAAPGDGAWLAVVDPEHAAAEPELYKTLIHPDVKRPWAELFVVAVDMRRSRVSFVPGTVDPEATTLEGRRYRRSGLIPEPEHDDLVFAFNGGFKTEHGHYGARVDEVTLIPPRSDVCTIASLHDGTLRIAPWKKIADLESEMVWWRQTPPCMLEAGRLHPGLGSDETRSWGAALGGDTVIRRSAIGLDDTRKTLFVGITNHTTARAIAQGMRHTGAHDVAQLDVNWSYPKIVVFRRRSSGELEALSLFPGFVQHADELLRKPSPRDFFYVVRRAASDAP